MITMISVSSFKLTLSATSLLFLSLSRCTVRNESFPVLLLFIIPPPYFNHSVSQPVAHSFTHSLILSLCHLAPLPSVFLFFIYLSICLFIRFISIWISNAWGIPDFWMRDSFHRKKKKKYSKVFPHIEKEEEEEEEEKKLS